MKQAARCYELSRIYPLKTHGSDFTVGRLSRSGYFQEYAQGTCVTCWNGLGIPSEQWVCCSLEFPLHSC